MDKSLRMFLELEFEMTRRAARLKRIERLKTQPRGKVIKTVVPKF
jgi:hypothetical protein